MFVLRFTFSTLRSFGDGDFYGVANALPSNANENAYYWLDVCATGALGVATIRVTCDGPSDLGDHVIIARANQLCHVPLLAGATYAVESDLPIDDSAVSSEYAEVTTNSTTSLTVSLPIELSFERVQMRGGSDIYIAHTSPIDVGLRIVDISGGCCSCVTNDLGFSWNCFPQCVCGGSGHSLSCAAEWEGYSHPFCWLGRCHCYYEDQAAIDEIESRGVSLEILDASGNAIEWKYPVLVGESVIVEATVGGSEMTVSDFVASAGADVLLGYCWKAPLDNQGAVRILNDWCSNRTALGDVESWMQANANRNGRNACAIQHIDDSHCRYWYFKREKGYIYNSYSLTNSIEAITR